MVKNAKNLFCTEGQCMIDRRKKIEYDERYSENNIGDR